jgi:hypothetical protein
LRPGAEIPRPPTHADVGPAAERQQPSTFCHSRSGPRVAARLEVTTVISCVASPVSRLFGNPSHAGAPARPDVGAATSASRSAKGTSGFTTEGYAAPRVGGSDDN